MARIRVLFLDLLNEFFRFLRGMHGRNVADENGLFLCEFRARFFADGRQIFFFHM